MPPKAPPAESTEQASDGAAQSPSGEPGTPAAIPTPSAASTPAPSSRPSLTPRASSTRGKPVVNAPRAANRRSQAARLEAAQTAARAKAAEAEAAAEEKKRKEREARRFGYRGNDRAGRGGGGRGGRGRGGHMGDSQRSRDDDVIASGPFSAGQVTAEAKAAAYARRFGAGAGGSGGSGAFSGGGGPGARSVGSGGGGSGGSGGGSGIKSEPGSGGTYHMSVKGMKSEDGGYVSSDDEEVDATVPKQDIDHMQVIDLTGEDAAPKRKDAFAPVRLTRIPHQERTVGLSIEDSTTESIVAPPERTTTEKRRGKQRAKDVEITGSTARPRRPTAYSSSSDTEMEQTYIKPDPDADDVQNLPASPSGQDITTIPEALRDAPSSPETKRKAKDRIKAIANSMGGDDSDDSDAILPDPPRFQTQAELDEWKRHYKDLRGIRNELGRQVPKTARPPPATDANGDTNMEGTLPEDPSLTKARKEEETRSQHVYLFQFPPVLPSLAPISVKPDPDSSTNPSDPQPMDVDGVKSTNPQPHHQPTLPSGHVGKLRIHKSGKATLDWGGTSLLLGMGADATFLQNVLIASVPEKKPAVGSADENKEKGKKKEGEGEGEQVEPAVGMGMGQVRGKFVVTPDWEEILR